ncbi:conserved exported hypothetical protein [Candidatus Nitrotoga sp. BS]|uniref:S1C family serine protease n=1 Tax=Candidatus Nitrotoga sp. BS TaxID=2890408 RepID=UPI001EF22140|nr:trypsin-like peptidase domain-containing protein [Candidatus Nitrotoga sp. BS]CAH1208971.1 conserved exported hypothetical protein [Candidatus Nitrotoga sp. BS]
MKLNLIGIIASFLLLSVISVHAENDEEVFSKAQHYTVQIRKAVSIPFGNDKKGTAYGAGFVVDTKRGWIMTNAHVVSRSPARLEVAFFGRKFVPAKKIYVDPFLDLAIIGIKEEMQNATSALPELECTNLPGVGRTVGTFGHPNGLKFTGTRGIISGHTAKYDSEMLQTDAPINPGNSGGPLISLSSGRIVGINTSRMDNSQNSNFAVPMQYACRVLALLREGKDPSPPDLPLVFFKASNERMQLKIARSLIDPAKFDFRPGDEILGVPGVMESVENETQLIHALRGRLGNVALRIKREGQQLVLNGKLEPVRKVNDKTCIMFSGVLLCETPPYMGLDDFNPGKIAVYFVEDGSVGDFNEIEKMDILNSVNGKKIETLDLFYSVLKTSQEENKPINFVFRDTGGKGKPSYFTYAERTLPVENLNWVSNEKNGD